MNFPGVDNLIYFFSQLSAPSLRWTDFVEILIIAYLTYHILLWVKDTRAWQLIKGIAVILVIALMAAVFNMTTIQWIFRNFAGIAVTALVIILQPELRNAMEELGRKNFLSSILGWEPPKTAEGRFSDKTVNELVRACTEMGRARTGALIVIEQTSIFLKKIHLCTTGLSLSRETVSFQRPVICPCPHPGWIKTWGPDIARGWGSRRRQTPSP